MSETGRDSSRFRRDSATQIGHMEEILINILSRLPAKTAVACKCVSKHWLRLISEPSFVKLQLSHSQKTPKYIICPYWEDTDNTSTPVSLMKGDGRISHTIRLPNFERIFSSDMVCFLNGLICSVYEVELGELNIQILNPTTQETLLLPQGSSSSEVTSVGMLFDYENNHYKVFRFFLDSDPVEVENVKHKCEVYSSDSETWKMIFETVDWIDNINLSSWPNNCVSIASTMYWLAWSGRELHRPVHIISIDMNNNFSRIDLPTPFRKYSFLIELESCLTLVWVKYDDSKPYLKLWKLKDRDWNLRASCELDIDIADICSVSSVASIDQGLLLIFDRANGFPCFCIFHLVDGTARTLDLGDTFEDCCPVVFPFTESLLKCNPR